MTAQAVQNLVDISATPAALQAHVDAVLERARWASQVYQRYDRKRTLQIADAAAAAAHQKAGEYGEWAVREAGFGVAAHKKIKNQLSSTALVDYYRNWDFVNPRINEPDKTVEIPRPAGVIFAIAPSTNPVATVNFKALSALLTRNAIVISPHPATVECCADAARTLARAAEEAGAPRGIIQVVDKPALPLIDAFMRSDKTSVILATGGLAMVRAAYSSGNPAIGVGPGNAPAFVDKSADLKKAARHLVESKSFDNSILCTNESVVIALAENDKPLRRALERAGAHLCDEREVGALRRYLFHERGFNVEALGRDAAWIAAQAGFRVKPNSRVLVAEITRIGMDEPLSKEKLCPVLGYYVAPGRTQAISQARGLLRLSGAGHSAAIHCNDRRTIMDYASSVEVCRVIVNAPCSQGAAGFGTGLAPSFTVGTGFFGRSSVGENIGPQHLVNWTRIAYGDAPDEPMPDFSHTEIRLSGPMPAAPADGVVARGATASPRTTQRPGGHGPDESDDVVREKIRRMIAEELRLIRGNEQWPS